jgi:hypothetical protein
MGLFDKVSSCSDHIQEGFRAVVGVILGIILFLVGEFSEEIIKLWPV